MADYWTTADIAALMCFGDDPTSRDARATARKWVERQRAAGVVIEFDIDPMSGEKRYRSMHCPKPLESGR